MANLFLCAAGNPEAVRLARALNQAGGGQRWGRIVLLDDDPAKQGQEIMGVRVVGPFAALAQHQPGDEAVNLVARSTKGREAARARIESHGIKLTSLVHPSVDVGGALLGRAVTIYAGATVSALSKVGDHAVIFTQAVLGHGATLGEGAVLAPGAVVNARVVIGARAYIGANAVVMPDLTVGPDATVSACSAALGDVPAGCTALGVPAEIMGAPDTAPALDTALSPAPAPDAAALAMGEDLRTAFGEVLGAREFAGELNFFEAGGSSKQALELHRLLRDRLGLGVAIVDIFRFPSPAQLASHLLGTRAEAIRPTRAALRRRRQGQSRKGRLKKGG